MNDTILINRLPTRTWNRLGVNETALTWGQADDLGEEKITAAGQTERLEITGSGERGEKMVDIHVPAGQTVTVFETLRAEKGLLVRTALHVEKDAKVRLVQIQNAAQDSLLRLETSGECAENGQVELIQVLLGRGDVYSDGQFELNGNGAGFTAGIGYLGQKQQTVDMNLVVNHWGQKTTSEINAAGALKDDAQKIFRGTIDFKKGSAGSVGSEQETVLMLGDGVVNKTVPLILCAEANVSPQKVFPHNLRHLFARVFYGIEKDIAKLADILGHSNINTTRIYIVSTGTEHRRRMEKMRLIL